MGSTESSENTSSQSRTKGRLLPFISYRHIIMIVISVSIIFLSILLAGCTSTGLKNVYLLSLSYTNNTSPTGDDLTQINPNVSSTFTKLVIGEDTIPSLEIRTGYLGICMRESPPGEWLCSRHPEDLADIILENNDDDEAVRHDPLNLIWIAKSFRSESIFSGLVLASVPLTVISFIALGVADKFDQWEADEHGGKPFPSKLWAYSTLAALAVSAVLTLVSILWQHIVSSAVVTMGQNLYYGTIQGHVGIVSMVLGWGGVFTDLLSVCAVIVQIVSLTILERMEDD